MDNSPKILELDELYWFLNKKPKTQTKENVYLMTMVSRKPRQIVGFDVAYDKSPDRIQAMVDSAFDAEKYCTDCYAVGTVSGEEDVAGFTYSKDVVWVDTISNFSGYYTDAVLGYYNATANPGDFEVGIGISEEQLKTRAFIESLGTAQEKPWRYDNLDINDGFPVLFWQKAAIRMLI